MDLVDTDGKIEVKPAGCTIQTPINVVAMRTARLLTGSVILVTACSWNADASAQGLLRRLRDRIAPVIQPPPAPDASGPARPIGGQPDRAAGANDPAADSNNRSSTATPGLTRVAPIGTRPESVPNPRSARSAVQPAGAVDPTRRSGPATDNTFGRSILSPLAPVSAEESANQESSSESGSGGSAASGRASIGIKAISANPGYPAVQVTEIQPGSLAAEAGLNVGDYIFAIDGIPTPTARSLSSKVSEQQPGESVTLRVGQSGRVRDIAVQLVDAGKISTSGSSRPVAPLSEMNRSLRALAQRLQPLAGTAAAPPSNFESSPSSVPPASSSAATGSAAGTELVPAQAGRVQPETVQKPAVQRAIGATVTDLAGRRGVEVKSVQKGSPAENAGLKPGDRIISVGGRLVANRDNLTELISDTDEEQALQLQVFRGGKLVDLIVDDSENASAAAVGSSAGGSMISGIGSMFGSMFNSGAGVTSEKARPADDSASPIPAPEAAKPETGPSDTPSLPALPLPAPVEKPADETPQKSIEQSLPEPAEKNPVSILPPIKDLMALGDLIKDVPKADSGSPEQTSEQQSSSAEQKKEIRSRIKELREEIARLEASLLE